MTSLGQHSLTCTEEIMQPSPLRQRLRRGENKEPSTWQTEAALEMLHNQNAFPLFGKQKWRGEWGHTALWGGGGQGSISEGTALLRGYDFLHMWPREPATHSLSSVRTPAFCYFTISRKRKSKWPHLCAKTTSFSEAVEDRSLWVQSRALHLDLQK